MTINIFANTNNYKGTAVFIIDLQYKLLEKVPLSSHHAIDTLLKKNQELISWAIRENVPVFIIETEGDGQTIHKIMDQLKQHTHTIIQKEVDSAFFGKSEPVMIKQLQEWDINNIIVGGINGCCCVHDTVLDAMVYLNLNVMTSSDLIGDINEDPILYPNDEWFWKISHKNFYIYENLNEIIK